jgi:predicted GIY-YIG superfamily endonuclease
VKAGFAFLASPLGASRLRLAGQLTKLGKASFDSPVANPRATACLAAMRFFYVYVIISKLDERIRYTGITRNLKARILIDNQGGCPHTSKFRPWYLEVAVAFKSETKAFERYLESGSGREFPRRHF